MAGLDFSIASITDGSKGCATKVDLEKLRQVIQNQNVNVEIKHPSNVRRQMSVQHQARKSHATDVRRSGKAAEPIDIGRAPLQMEPSDWNRASDALAGRCVKSRVEDENPATTHAWTRFRYGAQDHGEGHRVTDITRHDDGL
jgi:hypothetical protein